jgi:deoxyribodipyrimidine photo-lyase
VGLRAEAKSDQPVVLWFRQDLRLCDHAALEAASGTGRPVIPVYVLDEAAAGAWKPGGASRWWLHMSLAALAGDLARRGAMLILRRGNAALEIPSIARETGAAAVFTGYAAEPWARQSETAIARALRAEGIGLHRFRTATLFDPEVLRTQAGGVFGVFSPFARACFALGGPRPPLPSAGRFRTRPAPRSDALSDWGLLPGKPDWAGGLRAAWTPGEAGARTRLEHFLTHGLADYERCRNLPGSDGTSMLSPHLHWGELSASQVWHAAAHAEQGSGKALETFLKELLWREFSLYMLWHHPTLPDAPLRPEFGRMPWREDRAGLRAWQGGLSGIPIVDAGMRQLWHMGWMHNRVRMIVASFLSKHLLIPWQKGERWFWDTLVDADLASNSANWQWVAGCGTDAAPYFRVFNPVLQGRTFDPEGGYVRRWLPELAALDRQFIHAPWEAPGAELARAGVRLGETYPEPIIDLAGGRARALEAYRALKDRASPSVIDPLPCSERDR